VVKQKCGLGADGTLVVIKNSSISSPFLPRPKNSSIYTTNLRFRVITVKENNEEGDGSYIEAKVLIAALMCSSRSAHLAIISCKPSGSAVFVTV